VVLEFEERKAWWARRYKDWIVAGITSATLLEAARAFHAHQDFLNDAPSSLFTRILAMTQQRTPGL
jgi:hypothetical protein